MALLFMCACSQSLEVEEVTKKAVKVAEQKTTEEYGFLEEDEMSSPAGHFTRLKVEESAAMRAALDIIQEALGGEENNITQNVGYMDKLKECLNSYYNPKLEQAISDIEGAEIQCDYLDGTVASPKAVIQRDPNSSNEIRLYVELTLTKPSYSSTLSYYIGSMIGESSQGAAKIFPIEPQKKFMIDAGKKVKAYIPLNTIQQRSITVLAIRDIR